MTPKGLSDAAVFVLGDGKVNVGVTVVIGIKTRFMIIPTE